MTYREHAPHAALAPYVDRLWTSTGPAGPRLVVPDGCIDILVDVDRPDAPILVGAMTIARTVDAGASVRIVAVRFRPGRAAPFLRLAASELTDRHGDRAQVPWLRVDPRDPLASLSRGLRARLRAIAPPDPVVAYAVDRLASPTAPAIADRARDTGFTRQHLRRLFEHHVGLGPKQFGRIARLQRALAAVQRSPTADLAELALRLGYFDQAHMTRDFRALATLTPVAARALRGSISPIHSLYGQATLVR